MKDLFYNSNGYNTAKITIESLGKEIELYYHLNDNPVQHIWQNIHNDSKNFKMGISITTDIETLVERLNKLCKKIEYPLLTFPVTQKMLNDLHHVIVSFNDASSELSEMNKLIHIIESKLDERFSKYKRSMVFYKQPNTEYIPIADEYKLWLTTERKWGRLLLGYGTLGKDWKDISDNDDDTTDLNIQSTISSESLLIFDIDYPFAFGDIRKFYYWAKNSNFTVPLSNLNALSLGNYLLGEIIITDTFLDYHSTISDWYVINHKCKFNWGKDVLGNDPVVTRIDFFNSDLYLDTLLKHSNLDV
jgi:hypothetical protein